MLQLLEKHSDGYEGYAKREGLAHVEDEKRMVTDEAVPVVEVH